jgi:hypothetical protein
LSGFLAQLFGGDARAHSQDSSETIGPHKKSLAARREKAGMSDCSVGTSEDKVGESAKAAGKSRS